ncbi:hypothetical protein [Paragemmobacter ruber]|nr:hypothetical protein [Rhodobacter ruber]
MTGAMIRALLPGADRAAVAAFLHKAADHRIMAEDAAQDCFT